MSKKKITYTPLTAHLIRSNIGGHVSLVAMLPDGIVIEGAVMPGLEPALLDRYDIIMQPEGAPAFETSQVFSLIPKTAAPPAEKEEK